MKEKFDQHALVDSAGEDLAEQANMQRNYMILGLGLLGFAVTVLANPQLDKSISVCLSASSTGTSLYVLLNSYFVREEIKRKQRRIENSKKSLEKFVDGFIKFLMENRDGFVPLLSQEPRISHDGSICIDRLNSDLVSCKTQIGSKKFIHTSLKTTVDSNDGIDTHISFIWDDQANEPLAAEIVRYQTFQGSFVQPNLGSSNGRKEGHGLFLFLPKEQLQKTPPVSTLGPFDLEYTQGILYLTVPTEIQKRCGMRSHTVRLRDLNLPDQHLSERRMFVGYVDNGSNYRGDLQTLLDSVMS